MREMFPNTIAQVGLTETPIDINRLIQPWEASFLFSRAFGSAEQIDIVSCSRSMHTHSYVFYHFQTLSALWANNSSL